MWLNNVLQVTKLPGKKCLVLLLYKNAITRGCCQNFLQLDDNDDDDDELFLQNG